MRSARQVQNRPDFAGAEGVAHAGELCVSPDAGHAANGVDGTAGDGRSGGEAAAPDERGGGP